MGSTVYNPIFNVFVAGVWVMRHSSDDDLVARQCAHYTQTSGTGDWGVPLEAG